jgi:hypothetical protein
MRVTTSDVFQRWIRGAGMFALVALVWAVVVPDGIFWTAVLAAALMGAAVATAVLVRSRQVPTLAQVITSAEAEPVVTPAGANTGGAGLRPVGEQKS